MQLRIKLSFSMLVVIAVCGAVAGAQTPAVHDHAATKRAELALDYSYMHSNAPPGGCGCFNLNGGSGTFAWHFKPILAVVGDVTVTHGGAISSDGLDLTLSSFTSGIRYTPKLHMGVLKLFGQVLAGVAHSSGSLVDDVASNAGAAFDGQAGGGVDLNVSPRFSLRLVEADYIATTFNNGSNDHQNNFRLGAGVVFHF